MREKGLSRKQILAKLNQAHAKDLNYKDGKILCSMCTTPHPAAKRAHAIFAESNLGDPGLFPGSAELEHEVVASLAELMHCEVAAGFIVSGGTEANLLALWTARNQAGVAEPELVLPESTHFSFDKISNLLKIKPVFAKLDSTFRVDAASVERLVTKNTIAIVGNAGSSELGAIDPMAELSEIAQRRGVHLHVDAAFGGLVLPFLKELDYNVADFDFQLKGVASLTVDPHKMGLATVPAGGVLFRSPKLLEGIGTETPYLTEPCQYTFVGTRSGASAAATWAAVNSLGKDGYRKLVKQCMQVTTCLFDGLENAGFEVLLRPQMNIVAFRSANAQVLTQKLRQRGWFVSYIPRLDCVRVVVMPHTKKSHVDAFQKCLAELG